MGQKCQIITVVFKFQSRGNTPSILRQQLPTLGFYLISLLTHELSNITIEHFETCHPGLFFLLLVSSLKVTALTT